MAEARIEDQAEEQALADLLAYPDLPPDDGFTLAVMQRVRDERRRRRLVLGAFGGVGAAFGVAGAWLLSEPLRLLLAGLPAMGTMQAVLAVTAAIAFYGWFMNEDLDLGV